MQGSLARPERSQASAPVWRVFGVRDACGTECSWQDVRCLEQQEQRKKMETRTQGHDAGRAHGPDRFQAPRSRDKEKILERKQLRTRTWL